MANALLGLPSQGFVLHVPCIPFRWWLSPLRFPSCSVGHLAAVTTASPWAGVLPLCGLKKHSGAANACQEKFQFITFFLLLTE